MQKGLAPAAARAEQVDMVVVRVLVLATMVLEVPDGCLTVLRQPEMSVRVLGLVV